MVAPRSRAELWVEPVELAHDGITRTVAFLQDPEVVSIATQELIAGEWQQRNAFSLPRAAVERLIVAVGFR